MKTIQSLFVLPLFMWVAADIDSQGPPHGTNQRASMDLRTTLREYPVEIGAYWEYDVDQTWLEDSDRCRGTGKSTVKIEDVQDGNGGRVASASKVTVVSEIKNISHGPSDHCRDWAGDTDLPWTIVVVAGKVYEGSVFAEDLISRVLKEGVAPMEERGILPDYVMPLEDGTMWMSKTELRRVTGIGAVQTPAGLFPHCFKLSREWRTGTNRPNQETFCSGVGTVQGHYEEAHSTTDFTLRSFGRKSR
jgi:hypothetical protein